MLLFHHVATVLYLIKNKCGKVKQAVMKQLDFHGRGEIIMRWGVLINNKQKPLGSCLTRLNIAQGRDRHGVGGIITRWKCGKVLQVAMKERDFHGRGRVNNAVRCNDHKENHWEVA